MSSPAPARTPPGARALSAAIAALLTIAVCVFAAVEAIALAVHHQTLGFDVHAATRFGRSTHWDAAVVTVIGVAAAVIGLALLLAGLLPPRRRDVELASSDPLLAVGLSRASVRRRLSAAVIAIDGISSVRIRGRRALRITATATARDTTGLADAVQAAVTDQLDLLAPRQPHSARVRLDSEDR